MVPVALQFAVDWQERIEISMARSQSSVFINRPEAKF